MNDQPCGDCNGATVNFRGRGLNTQYRLCPRWTEPGHLSEQDIKACIAAVMRSANPSGRTA